jgi:thiol-disulfide isomerase/thioredoxin
VTEANVKPNRPYVAHARRALAGAAICAAVLGAAPAGADTPRSAVRAAASATGTRSAGALQQALARRSLQTLDGKTVTWQSLQGEVVVVNFWATWCKPCRKELPRLAALDRELAKSGGRVIAVSVDLDRENVRRFAQANHLELAICHDGPDGLAKEMALEMLPTTLVLDRNGTTAYASTGADDEAIDALVAKARALAAERRVAVSSEVPQ